MKIAYVAITMNRKLAVGGVGRKMNMQAKIWREMGHEACIFVLSSEDLPYSDWHIFKTVPFEGPRLTSIFQREFLTSFFIMRLINDIKAYQPDIILFRYYRYYLGFERIYKIAPVVVELNTNDVVEMGLSSSIRGPYNELTRPIIFRSAAGFTPVSHEIAELPDNTRYNLPTLVLGNGINVEKLQFLPAPANPQPRFVMMSSDILPWHGVDKVINFFKKYPDLQFDLVGYSPKDFSEALPPNICAHGFIPHSEVSHILAKADVVFGTMALHRKRMNEASPLKVREALASGIPVVIAYDDTDLMDVELDTVLQIPNTEDNMETHAEAIRDFAYRMRGRRIPRHLVVDRIDYRHKEKQRLEFFQQILSAKNI